MLLQSCYTHRVYFVRVGRFITFCRIYIRQVSHARILIVMGISFSIQCASPPMKLCESVGPSPDLMFKFFFEIEKFRLWCLFEMQ